MSELKQVLCVKWGTRFGPAYVNRLHAMVARNVTPPFRVICLTDDPAGIRSEVDCRPLPELGVPHPVRTTGKWRKVALWGRDVSGLSGTALFLDLDSVIVGGLDPYFSLGEPDDVILARNWTRPLERLGQTSVFRFPIGKNSHILDDFRADPQGIADRYGFEQHYMTHAVHGGVKLWPGDWTRHFRMHCLGPWPLRYLRPAKLPAGARIVTFPGGPNPSEAVDGRWRPDDPPYAGPWAHLARAFAVQHNGRRNPWQHIKRFVRPVPWIREHWRE